MDQASTVNAPVIDTWKILYISATIIIVMCIKKLLTKPQITAKPVKQPNKQKSEALSKESTKSKESAVSTTGKNKKKPSENRRTGRGDKQTFNHPWLLTSLKGHSAPVLDIDFSSDGKYLASCGEDRAVVLWCTKDLRQKEHKSLRVNIEYDHATRVRWSPDTKAFIIHKATENCAEVYKVDRRKDGWFGSATKVLTFPKIFEEDVVGIGIACNGRFIMTCSEKNDLCIWDLKGQQLARIDTYLMNTHCAKVSPCGRFIAASGFAPDCKVWEVVFNKTGDFQTTKRAFELTGHTSGIFDMAFTPNSSHMATVSKDGSWKVYDTNIEYHKGEDPHLLITGKYQHYGSFPKIALSPNAEVLVVSTLGSLSFYNVVTGELDKTIEDIFSGDITQVLFDSTGKYVLASGDKHIRIFHNVTGYRTEIETFKSKLRQPQTSATKERLQKTISDNKVFLENLQENI